MNAILRNALAVAGVAFAAQAVAQITFYEREGFEGRTFTTEKRIGDFERFGFNDRASSVDVVGNRWEVCEDARFSGRCVVLRPGRYPSLASLGLNNRISSARVLERNARIEDSRYGPVPVVARDGRDYRRRNEERVYEANVTSVRAVVGTAGQRCWVEREQIPQERRNISVPGAVVGAVIGGILGHQIGDGKRVVTAGGAVAGGALGANVGRIDAQQAQTQDVQRCENVSNQTPTYWDVTYHFRGQEHRVQMSTQPGPTITVNERGEPRA
ncbi:MAG: beta/gamma crystallin-related protein [Pseudomonadota bacterium]